MAADPSIHTAAPVAPDPEGEEVSLQEYLGTLVEARWLILAVAAAALLAGLLFVKFATPVYRSDVLVQVEEKKSAIAGLEGLSDMFPGESPADTEIEILRSRAVVGAVVDQLHLDVESRPRHLPLVGAALARGYKGQEPAPARFGLARFGWGGERLQVDRLSLAPGLENEKLTLVAGAGGAYELFDPDGDLLLRGEVGKPAASAAAGQAALFVSELRARPGTQFRVVKRPRQMIVEQLQKDLVIAEKGKKTGIIRVELSDPDVARLVGSLDVLSDVYVRQNVQRKSAEAEKTLDFIDGQLPDVQRRLEKAEQALNAYKSKHQTVDLSLETKAALDEAVNLDKSISELQIQKAEVEQRFTGNHPFVATMNKKLGELEAQRAELAARFKGLPETELDSVRLIRDAKVAQDLYVLLLNKAQELKVAKNGTVGNVRVLDRAVRPLKPVFPEPAQTVALSLVLGLVLGVAGAFVKRALHHGVEDPEQLEAATGLSVFASVPHSPVQEQMVRDAKRGEPLDVLAHRDPTDLAVESLRSLRTAVQFALLDAPSKVIVLGGPGPGIGKTFVAGNLAHVLAEAGGRVLLVDADLRNGSLHRFHGFERGPGLSEVIAGAAKFEDVVHREAAPKVDLLTQGAIPPNPSALLMSPRFKDLLARLSREYDAVVLDTPPILAVTDAAIVGRLAAVTLLVLRAGQHPVREITAAVKRFVQGGVQPTGLVFNDVTRLGQGYGYGYGYHYQYEYKKKAG
ncbi:MAG TPA: polysaccharide biosynthesis tyrosine autokinase [Anaeromyxobacteraceae bacterium]|jgi:tyrosine-protein kinase Etk/Wzc|nr:polysaccharide biosynthesis tyrosine autokinase [Anaeromyxobacteraceae bacterium]